MDKKKLACAASNFLAGRPSGITPEAIVLHRTGGSAEQIRVRFVDAATAMSAHYVVELSGDVIQYVEERDTAFHAGLVVNPSSALCQSKPKVNPNFYTIGIEFEGSPDDPFPEEQLAAGAALVAEIAARCQIAIDAAHLLLHSEIRASRNCPGTKFGKAEFLQRAMLAAKSPQLFAVSGPVDILKDTSLREGLPSSAARIVAVLTKGSKVTVNAFTVQGEAINGNSAWYQTPEGNFFWAGGSAAPQPRQEQEPEDIVARGPDESATPVILDPTRLPVAACRIGISEIDQFFSGAACPPVDLKAKPDDKAVGAIQDLLTGHGFTNLPSILAPGYGIFGDRTEKALASFQTACGLAAEAALTPATMQHLVGVPAKDPRATEAHLSLVLGIPFNGIQRVVALTAQMEGNGKFAALNQNTDGAGLSFGLIQWAQSQGRLLEIVSAFRAADEEAFVRIFGAGDAKLGDLLIAHLKKPAGGVARGTGITTDPEFNLVASPWVERFREAALYPKFQQAQVTTAAKAFNDSLGLLRQYDTAGLVKHERAVAFMLDVANQFGDGSVQKPPPPRKDLGLAALYRQVYRAGMKEMDLLNEIADATVKAMAKVFQTGVGNRRKLFLTTPLLSDSEEFHAAPAVLREGA